MSLLRLHLSSGQIASFCLRDSVRIRNGEAQVSIPARYCRVGVGTNLQLLRRLTGRSVGRRDGKTDDHNLPDEGRSRAVYIVDIGICSRVRCQPEVQGHLEGLPGLLHRRCMRRATSLKRLSCSRTKLPRNKSIRACRMAGD